MVRHPYVHLCTLDDFEIFVAHIASPCWTPRDERETGSSGAAESARQHRRLPVERAV